MRPFTLDIFINNDKEDLKRKWERIREEGIQKLKSGKTKTSEITHKPNKRQKKRLTATGDHLELDRSGSSQLRLR